MAITPSEPDVPRPLIDREHRILDTIGQDLTLESPGLGKQLSTRPDKHARRRSGPIDDVICVVAVIVILVMLLPREWLAVAVLLVVMAGPAILAARYRSGDNNAGSASNESDPRGSNRNDIR